VADGSDLLLGLADEVALAWDCDPSAITALGAAFSILGVRCILHALR
jgi:hypothetical protein